MFEERTDILKEHIAYLEGLLADDSDKSEELDLEELQGFLETCQEDIDALRLDLPYDEIDEDDIPIEDFSGDNLEEAEIEDEVVEAEKVIEDLQQLMEEAREHFLEEDIDSESPVDLSSKSNNLSEEEFMKKLEDWLDQAFRDKFKAEGLERSEEEIIALRKRTIQHVIDKESSLFPDYSIGLTHITYQMMNEYDILKRLMNFDNSLRCFVEFWGNVI